MTEEQAQAQIDDDSGGDFPEAWRPDPGDRIAGTVVAVTMSPDFGYGPYPIVTITEEGSGAERAIHAMHHTLRTELARRRPSRGDELDITYHGKRQVKGDPQRNFHSYRVAGGKEPEFDWSAELPEEERGRYQAPAQDVPIPPAPVPSQRPQAAPEPVPGSQFGDDAPFLWRSLCWETAKMVGHNPFA